MAIATAAEINQAVIEARWRQATVRPIRFSNESRISLDVSKRYLRINDGIEEMAALLVDDGVRDEEKDECDDSLDRVMYDIWNEIETRLKAWAGDERRTARLKAIRTAQEAHDESRKAVAA